MFRKIFICMAVSALAAVFLCSCSAGNEGRTASTEESSAVIEISTIKSLPAETQESSEESTENTDSTSEEDTAKAGEISRESFTVLYKCEPVSLEGVDLDRLYLLVDEAGKNTDMMLNELILNEEMEEGKKNGLYLEVIKPYKNQRGETLITYVIIKNGGGCCCTGFGSKILLTRQTVSDILDTLGLDPHS